MSETAKSRPSGPEGLRILVACPACGLQFDATGRPSGDSFHCACGAVLSVPEPSPDTAAVVRCSSCGGPRDAGRRACGYCGSDFTLHERDLHTICPVCLTRISDRARFCHSCAAAIAPQSRAGELTDRRCPACGERRRLASRRLEENVVTVLECGGCTGLWLGSEVFRLLEERARERQTAWQPARRVAPVAATAERPVYRPCVVCAELMHRRNYGRKSGVILDVCADHGIWFDAGELDRVLRWIREGGLLAAEVAEATERRELAGRHRPLPADPSAWESAGGRTGLGRLVGAILDLL